MFLDCSLIVFAFALAGDDKAVDLYSVTMTAAEVRMKHDHRVKEN